MNEVVLDLFIKLLLDEVRLHPDDVLCRLRLDLFQMVGLVKFAEDGSYVLLVRDKDFVGDVGLDLGGAL